MSSLRKTAVVAGVFYLVTEVAAVAGLLLYNAVLNNPDYILGRSGNATSVLLGAFSELILVIAVVGSAVTLFPILKRQNEGIALGYVAGRIVEAVFIVVGILSLLAVVTLRQDYAGAAGTTAASLVVIGKSLVAIHSWTFLLGPDLVLGVHTLLLAYLMYTSGLVPRFIAVLGLVGGPMIFASATAVTFGLYAQTSTLGAVAAIPVFAWEVSLALWLVLKGFKATPLTSDQNRYAGVDQPSLNRAPAAG